MLIDNEEVVLGQTQKSLLSKEREKRIIEETRLYKIRYLVDHNISVEGFYALPVEVNKKLPVIVWCRGGFQENGKLTDLTAFITLGEIANWGYCVFASQYRQNEKLGNTDIEDILGLIKIIGEFSFTDSDNLALEGWSRGGLVALLCLKYDLKFNCAVVIAGLTDLDEYCDKNSQRKLGNRTFCKKDEVHKISPLNNYKSFKKIPILFIHGTGDEVISYKQSMKIYDLLKDHNKDICYELELIEGGSHTLKENRDYVAIKRKQWYDKYLKNIY